MAKRKHCATHDESFPAANYSRHIKLCSTNLDEDPENEKPKRPEEEFSAVAEVDEEIDEEEEVYLDEEEIKDLLHSFQPREAICQQAADEPSNNTTF